MKKLKVFRQDIRRHGIKYALASLIMDCEFIEFSRIKRLRRFHSKCYEYCWNMDYPFIFEIND